MAQYKYIERVEAQLTTAQRDALTPVIGTTIWNTDTAQKETYNGTNWAVSVGTKEVFFATGKGAVLAVHGDFAVLEATSSGGSVMISWRLPKDFVSLVSLEVIAIPEGTDAAADYDLFSDYASVGQAYNTHSESDTASTYDVTTDEIIAIDASGVFSSMVAEDFCGLQIKNNDNANLNIIGVLLKYK